MSSGHMAKVLERAFGFEKSRANLLWMTQPVGGGQVKTFTWKEGFDQARRMASHLASLNLPPGSNIALISKNTAWWIFADLAIWLAGHVSVPIYPTLLAGTVKQILEHSEAKLVFVGKLDDWPAMKDGIAPSTPKIAMPLAPETDFPRWDELVEGARPLEGDTHRGPDEVATLVYTSGSTGTAKGVMLTFAAMSHALESALPVFGPTPEDRMLSYLPLAHVMERAVVETLTLYSGSQVFFAEALETFIKDLNRARPTLFVSVPRLWLKFQSGVLAKMPAKKLNRLLKIPILSGIVKKKVLTGLGLDQVRIAFTGSAPMPAAVLEWYRTLGLELLEAYGMSENFCISHISKPGRVCAGYVGEPWPGVESRISPEGEVQMKCGALMKGYYKAPELTAEVFTEDGFLRTGDRGEVDAEGRLKITGRLKELFKSSKGKYVAPVPIENILLQNGFLESGAVMGAGRPQPCAVVNVAEAYRDRVGDPALREKITRSLAQSLTEVNAKVDLHEQLEFVAIAADAWTIPSGVLTPTMKVKRQVVEQRYEPQLDAWYAAKKRVLWEDPAAASHAA